MNLLSRLRLHFQQRDESSEDDLITRMDYAIQELELAKTQLEKALQEVKRQNVSTKNKAQEVKRRLRDLEQSIKRHVKRGHKSLAQGLLQQKKQQEQALKGYQELLSKLQENQQRLSTQLDLLTHKLEQLRLDKTLLRTNLTQAKAQQQVSDQLTSLENNGLDWESVEDEVNRTAFEIELKLDDHAFEGRLLEETLEDLETAQVKKAEEESLQQAEKMLSRTPKKADIASSQKQIEDFFEERESDASIPQEKIIEKFLGEDTKPNTPDWEDFFK
ncbi:MAG: PspA/IM30 family protein [Bacteroidota bacterium]